MIRTEKGHFWITFENGLTLSVFNGFGSYTENHFNIKLADETENQASSETCEIAVMDQEGNWMTNTFINCNGDNVIGYIKPEKLAKIMQKISKYKGD